MMLKHRALGPNKVQKYDTKVWKRKKSEEMEKKTTLPYVFVLVTLERVFEPKKKKKDLHHTLKWAWFEQDRFKKSRYSQLPLLWTPLGPRVSALNSKSP